MGKWQPSNKVEHQDFLAHTALWEGLESQALPNHLPLCLSLGPWRWENERHKTAYPADPTFTGRILLCIEKRLERKTSVMMGASGW